MKRDFPDVVAVRAGAPSRLFGGNAFQGLSQIRAVPGLLPVAFVEQGENNGVLLNAFPPVEDRRFRLLMRTDGETLRGPQASGIETDG